MHELTPIKFNEEVVITTKILAQVYECDEKQIKQNYNNNKEKFIECKHYYKLEGETLRKFKQYCKVENFDFVKSNVNCLYLWTRRGASRHCKMLGTDKAWEMFDTLEENYFNPKVPQITNEQLKAKLLLDIYNGGENGVLASKQLAELEKKPLIGKIEEDKPKVEAYERFINSGFTYTATALKGIFGFSSAVAMNKKLHELKLIYKPGNSKKWTAYEDTPKEWYKVLVTEFGDILKWTSKGILGIADLLAIKLSEDDIENLINNDNKDN